MDTLTDILVERKEKQKKYFQNPQKYAQIAKEEAARILPRLKAYLFGSILEGEATPASDIDLLIVSPKIPQKALEQTKIKIKIEEKIGPEHPFEIHLVTPKGLSWYNRFIKKKVEV